MALTVNCWGNAVLKVDLTSGEITKDFLNEDLRKKFLTGRGMNDWLLYKMTQAKDVDPLSPQNVMVFGVGLLVGCQGDILVPGAIRLVVNFLNTLSGAYGETSSAGTFATELKRAGYDHLVVCGRSARPVYLWIDGEQVEIRDAGNLIGKTTFETDEAIKKELGDVGIKTCTVGPGGENLVRYAILNVTNRYCGRCGGGTVMGSKNLKAIAVRGTSTVEPFYPERMAEISGKVDRLLKGDEGVNWLAKHGMAGTVDGANKRGTLSVKNYQGVGFDRVGEVGYEAVKKYYKKELPCFNCPVLCDRLVEIPEDEPYGGTWVNSMQSTPSFNFAKFLIDDINTVIKGFELCNGLGIDVMSFSTVAQWAIECYERGILNRQDTDKLDLRWGDGPLVLEMIKRTAYREGKFGSLLADGVWLASKKIGRGSEKYAMQMKKMEIDDELRTSKGWCLGIITDPRGPTHTHGAFRGELKGYTRAQAKEIYGNEELADPQSYVGKPEIVAEIERARIIQDCLGLCFFATHRSVPAITKEYNMKTYAELIEAATGWVVSEGELTQIAERALAIEKAINVLAGIVREDDYPPDRFYDRIPDGLYKGISLDKEKVIEMVSKHDELHGWDSQTGVPTRNTLEGLDLREIADRLDI